MVVKEPKKTTCSAQVINKFYLCKASLIKRENFMNFKTESVVFPKLFKTKMNW